MGGGGFEVEAFTFLFFVIFGFSVFFGKSGKSTSLLILVYFEFLEFRETSFCNTRIWLVQSSIVYSPEAGSSHSDEILKKFYILKKYFIILSTGQWT